MKNVMVLLISAGLIAPASAWYVPPVVVVPPPVVKPVPPLIQGGGGGGAGAGAWAAGGIIGIAAVLVGYDIARRWTCIGDPWRLGGPGFSQPMPKYQNVKAPPRCGHRHHRGSVAHVNMVRVKG